MEGLGPRLVAQIGTNLGKAKITDTFGDVTTQLRAITGMLEYMPSVTGNLDSHVKSALCNVGKGEKIHKNYSWICRPNSG